MADAVRDLRLGAVGAVSAVCRRGARQVALRVAILTGRGQRSLLPARRELSRHGVSAQDGSVIAVMTARLAAPRTWD